MKKLTALLLMISLLLCCLPCRCLADEEKSTLADVMPIDEKGTYSCTYGGDTRKFILCLPEKAEGPIPTIFMLHGSGSSASAFRVDTKMDEAACSRGYAVVYLSAAKNKISRTIPPAWNSGIGETGVDDAGFLTALAQYGREAFGFDAQRTYLAGFSNGAFMVHRMASAADGTFAGYASIAGMMPEKAWNARSNPGKICFLQVNGTKDDSVPMHLNGSAQASKDPAIEDVISWYVSEAELTQCTSEELCPGTMIDKYTDGQTDTAVWFALIEDGHHAWLKKEVSGFSANELILDFFDSIR